MYESVVGKETKLCVLTFGEEGDRRRTGLGNLLRIRLPLHLPQKFAQFIFRHSSVQCATANCFIDQFYLTSKPFQSSMVHQRLRTTEVLVFSTVLVGIQRR